MLDIKRIRQNPDELRTALANRNKDSSDVDTLLSLDEKRREIMSAVESMKAKRNQVSAEVPKLKKQGADVSGLTNEMKELGQQIKALDDEVRSVDKQFDGILLAIPNIPNSSVPIASDESGNVEIRKWGEIPNFSFEAKAHWDIGTDLGILDFEAAAKITGARFTVYRDMGARLERSVINFFLNTHTGENGYTEVLTPFLANSNSMRGTGQLPKFAEDMFHVEHTDYYLIPTSEVSVGNIYRDSILQAEELPIHHCAYSACFRAEAGSAGRDTRGLIRQHQFNKVELIKLCKPENSYDELESMTKDAESVLQKLGLPYRVVQLSTGDMGFSSAKTYDIEVWMPSYGRYVEISSCSNCEDFQARRANIKYRTGVKEKPAFLHMLNGSGVAVGRTVAAILENYQREDGSVQIPDALKHYMGCDQIG